jgi:sec-independent protein translocase protein TatA
MGSFSIWHWLVVGIVLLLLFGKGRFSEMMGDVAKGIKNFKKGMTEEEEEAARAEQQRRLNPAPPQPNVIAPQPGDVTPAPAADHVAAPPAADGTQR